MLVEHTQECLEKTVPLIKERVDWLIKWPGHCRKCEGAGELHWLENQSPLGSGEIWMMDMGDVCEHCLCENKCPRCGKVNNWKESDWDANEGVTCEFCGWEEKKPDICPPGPDGPCDCEIEEMNREAAYFYQQMYDDLETPDPYNLNPRSEDDPNG